MPIMTITRGDGLVDALRSWTVMVDGQARAKVRRKRTVTVEVAAGRRVVQMRIGDRGSKEVVVLVGASGCRMTCRPRLALIEAARSGDVQGLLAEVAKRDERIVLELGGEALSRRG